VESINNETDTDVLHWYSMIADGNDPTAADDTGDGGS